MNRPFAPYPFTPRRHEARLPIPGAAPDSGPKPVAIIGGGPVGLALALGLANFGVRSVVFEADDSVCTGSRAICVSRRSLEIIARLGALPAFLDKGLAWTGGRSFYRDAEVLHFKMPHDENQKLPPMLNLEQFYIEQFLLDAAEQKPELIDIRWQTKLTGVKASEDGADLSLSTPLGEYEFSADWAIACDGGRSLVREAMGLALKGASYEGRYIIADILLRSQRPAERLAWFDPPSNPGSTLLMHKQPGDVWRIDYQLRDDEDADEAVKPENVIPRVASHLAMIGESADWSPIWITLYRAHALSLESYRHGRVLFAGDAAHLVPIFGVRGLNSGIDDADNLGWKLALVVKGHARHDLLDSFSTERVAATRENLNYGRKSTEFMAPPTPAFSLMRQAALSLAVKHERLRSLINPRQTQAITYHGSRLNFVSAQPQQFSAGPVPGATLPECPLTICRKEKISEGHLTDLLGPCFTALYFSDAGEHPEILAAIESAIMRAHIPFALAILTRQPARLRERLCAFDHSGRLFSLFGAQPGCLYLIRPDGHVLARWPGIDAKEIMAALAGCGLDCKLENGA